MLTSGVILEPPKPEDAQYDAIFGAPEARGASFDWTPWSPTVESQGATGDCTAHSRTNAAEFVAKRTGTHIIEGVETNFSALYPAVGSGTTLQGNSLRAPAEFVRITGTPLENDCTYDPDMLQMPEATWAKRQMKFDAAKDKPKYKLGNYSWVQPVDSLLKDALTHSPLQIAVGIGDHYQFDEVVRKPNRIYLYHAIVLTGIDEHGIKHLYDSSLRAHRMLAADYPILYALSFRDLPADWKAKNTAGDLLLKRFHGAYILRAEAQGQIYLVDANARTVTHVEVNGKLPLFDDFIRYLANVKKALTGISEQNFKSLEPFVVNS